MQISYAHPHNLPYIPNDLNKYSNCTPVKDQKMAVCCCHCTVVNLHFVSMALLQYSAQPYSTIFCMVITVNSTVVSPSCFPPTSTDFCIVVFIKGCWVWETIEHSKELPICQVVNQKLLVAVVGRNMTIQYLISPPLWTLILSPVKCTISVTSLIFSQPMHAVMFYLNIPTRISTTQAKL